MHFLVSTVIKALRALHEVVYIGTTLTSAWRIDYCKKTTKQQKWIIVDDP